MSSLERRIEQLEKGEFPRGPPGLSQRKGTPQYDTPKRDWDFLGGDEGDTVVVGGFRPLASREERDKEWGETKNELPEDMVAQIASTIIPASPGPIVILHLHKEGDTRATRVKMLDWTKKFKEQGIQKQMEGEATARLLYAGPSKPFEMRQRNAKTMAMLDGFKLIAGEDKSVHLRADLARGRIIYEQKLLAERREGETMPTPIMDAVEKVFPGNHCRNHHGQNRGSHSDPGKEAQQCVTRSTLDTNPENS